MRAGQQSLMLHDGIPSHTLAPLLPRLWQGGGLVCAFHVVHVAWRCDVSGGAGPATCSPLMHICAACVPHVLLGTKSSLCQPCAGHTIPKHATFLAHDHRTDAAHHNMHPPPWHLMVMKFLSDLDILRPSISRWPECKK